MPSHEHQWVFAGEVVIPTKETKVLGNPFNRLEYCIDCGAFRIQFKMGWRYWYSDATKRYLDGFESESHKVLKLPPPEFKLAPPSTGRSDVRLGRGLLTLMQNVLTPQTVFHALPGTKPNGKK